MHWAVNVIQQAGTYARITDATIMGAIAHDVLERDINAAPSEKSAWLITNPDHIMWCNEEGKTTEWFMTDNTLVRKHGDYDPLFKKWKKQSVSVVAQHVGTFECTIESDNQFVHDVQSILHITGAEPISRYMYIRNRRDI